MRTPFHAPAYLPLLVVAGLADGCQSGVPEAGADRAEPMPVATRIVQPEAGYAIRRRFTGVVRSRRTSELAFERPGLVIDLRFDEGDTVRPGALLARLDVSQLRVRRRELAAALREAEARVELSDVTSTRLRELAAEQFTSRQSSDEAKFGLAARRAAADRLRAAIEAVDVDLRKSRLTAPFGGTVAERSVDEGEVIAPGQPIFRFLERERPEARVGVPVELAAQLEVGTRHVLKLDGRSVSAELSAIVDDVDPNTRTRALVFDWADDSRATDGQVVQLQLDRPVESRGYWLPVDAITEGLRGLWTVYTVSDRDRIVREAVEVLYMESDRVFVRGTLEPGDRVVTGGLHRVVPGQAVHLASADEDIEP